MFSIIVLTIVFFLIAFRQIGNIRLQIWQIMLGGAVVVLMAGKISIPGAVKAVNYDVLLFLFGMFVVGEALENSGYLSYISYNFFKKAQNTNSLLLLLIISMGALSVFLMNDTVAIIGTPLVLMLAKKNNIPSKPFLLALAFSVTIGSVACPLGNPQNLLIALNSNVSNIFGVFGKFLLIPTVINLFVLYYLLKRFYKDSFDKELINHQPGKIKDESLASLSKFSLGSVFFLVAVKIILLLLNYPLDFRLTFIALIAAFPILLFSNKRVEIIRRIDWQTLIFFASMFILMQCVWDSGIFQGLINRWNINITSVPMILVISIVLSQLISNVPLVALYMPLLVNMGVSPKGLMALAAGSTIAGNLFILGAASNIIIIQNSEKRGGDTISFKEFSLIGIPLTILNAIIYLLYFSVL